MQQSLPSKGLLLLARVSNIIMILVLMVGFLDTETGSALGCGRDWPLCDGRFSPPFDLHGLVEYGHRFVAGVEGILVVWLAIWAWRTLRRAPEVKVLAVLMVLFTYIQAVLGAVSVVFPTSPAVLATHFGVSLIAFAAVLLLDVRLYQAARTGPNGEVGWTWRTIPVPQRLRVLVWLTGIYLVGLVYLGALVSHTATGLLCDGWPLCRGSILPPLTGQVWIPYVHRVAALIAILLVLWIFLWARRLSDRPDVRSAATWSFGLILLQSLFGWYLVASDIALGAIMLHITGMTTLFGVYCYLALQVAPAPRSGP